ncbi:hypothetical protein Q4591_02085 [Shewanella sp. 3_MG-2023]|uniref:DUF6795 domain-containing protein n=1 Tax=Shewanella sp. 3_MG-2023 TaxID=3062635 RepID=UPI0026E32C13|nr:DUF6795 domain-containing protein [Shewanella sp. 3_MG-2023]MDO6774129.1 hypothetical protein [Shewanella sp. 3_MG-2023]
MFKKVDVEAFPEVSGSLSHNGQPLAGIKLKRGYQYSGVMEDRDWDYTTTDNEGKFSFPEIIHRTSHPHKPFANTNIAQVIAIAEGNFTDMKLWHSITTGKKHIPLLAERLAQLYCDVANEVNRYEIIDEDYPSGVVRYQILSICRWPEMDRLEAEKHKKYN